MEVLAAILIIDVFAFATCLFKGKYWFAGLVLLFAPLTLIGAIRLAKPTSYWARAFYPRDGHQMAEAIHRFPKSADKLEAREAQHLPPAPIIKKVF